MKGSVKTRTECMPRSICLPTKPKVALSAEWGRCTRAGTGRSCLPLPLRGVGVCNPKAPWETLRHESPSLPFLFQTGSVSWCNPGTQTVLRFSLSAVASGGLRSHTRAARLNSGVSVSNHSPYLHLRWKHTPTKAQPPPMTSWGKPKEGLHLWEGEMNRHNLSARLSTAGLSYESGWNGKPRPLLFFLKEDKLEKKKKFLRAQKNPTPLELWSRWGYRRIKASEGRASQKLVIFSARRAALCIL